MFCRSASDSLKPVDLTGDGLEQVEGGDIFLL
jgi:hypothetical protein